MNECGDPDNLAMRYLSSVLHSGTTITVKLWFTFIKRITGPANLTEMMRPKRLNNLKSLLLIKRTAATWNRQKKIQYIPFAYFLKLTKTALYFSYEGEYLASTA